MEDKSGRGGAWLAKLAGFVLQNYIMDYGKGRQVHEVSFAFGMASYEKLGYRSLSGTEEYRRTMV
jgi:hypothetical protein